MKTGNNKKMKQIFLSIFVVSFAAIGCVGQQEQQQTGNNSMTQGERHRPRFHFSPKSGWMNDPNGMVYLNGKYHLFFQHNPDTTIWGPMHWGHAVSSDLMHWEEQAIALYPDSLGTIFSGSAVIDKNNTAGFGKDAMVAIFTHHNPEIEKTKSGLHQYQSLAYSLDEGKNWTKYEGNPVLPNPGIWDFRDPKVMWHESSEQWIMTLATKQTITFYSSPDLKKWTRLSEFGEGIGAHTGVWECPDLFSIDQGGKTHWVLLVSINPGGPNGGSATQYFVGEFDGKKFTPHDDDTRWVDYGRDNYAGVTFSNVANRRVFMGWMSNWDYANVVPTEKWRSASTLPRELGLQEVDGKWFLNAKPVTEFEKILGNTQQLETLSVKDETRLNELVDSLPTSFKLDLEVPANKSFAIKLSNQQEQTLQIGFDAAKKEYYVDRTKSGKSDFSEQFATKHFAPRIAADDTIKLSLVVDVASTELFADEGLTVMTDIFFPDTDFTQLSLITEDTLNFQKLSVTPIAVD